MDTKDSTNRHKRLNKWHNSPFEMEENEEIFKKVSQKTQQIAQKTQQIDKRLNKKHKRLIKETQKTQQRDTKDSTNSKKKTK